MRAWWLLIAVAACGKDKPDCAKYAAHLTELGTAGLEESRKHSVEFAARESCDNGRVSATVASCVIAASSMDDVRKCEGLPPIEKPAGKPGSAAAPVPPAVAPARQIVKRRGYSVAVPAGWRAETAKVDANEVLLRGPRDPQGAFLTRVHGTPQGLASDAACRGIADKLAKDNGATVKAAQVSQTKLGPSCHTVLLDPKMVVESEGLAAGSDTMTVTCFYELTRTDPADYCAEIFDSLTLD